MHIENLTISGATFRGIITDFNAISGGTVTYYNNYTIHTITANTVLTIESLGTVDSAIELFMVGGGGGGGSSSSQGGGGGGGGGFFYNANVILPVGQYNVVIGDGGLGHNVITGQTSTNGGNTTLAGMIALGGGKGGPGSLGTTPSSNTYYYQSDLSGGNGGGAPGGRFNQNYTYLGGLGLQDDVIQSQTNQASTLSASGANQGGQGIGVADNSYHCAGGGAAYGYFGNYGSDVRTIDAFFDGFNAYAGAGGGGWNNKNPITGSVHGQYAVTPTYPSGAYFLGGGGGGAYRGTTNSSLRGQSGIGGGGVGGHGTTNLNYLSSSSGTNGYGGGGGGGVAFRTDDTYFSGSRGGSGCVIIKYRNS